MQKIYETVVMRIGRVKKSFNIPEEVAKTMLPMFANVPIVWNKDQAFKDYTKENQDRYKELIVIGTVIGNTKIVGDKVLADIELKDEYAKLWKGSHDNWCVDFEKLSDDEFANNAPAATIKREKFKPVLINSIEVF